MRGGGNANAEPVAFGDGIFQQPIIIQPEMAAAALMGDDDEEPRQINNNENGNNDPQPIQPIQPIQQPDQPAFPPHNPNADPIPAAQPAAQPAPPLPQPPRQQQNFLPDDPFDDDPLPLDLLALFSLRGPLHTLPLHFLWVTLFLLTYQGVFFYAPGLLGGCILEGVVEGRQGENVRTRCRLQHVSFGKISNIFIRLFATHVPIPQETQQ